jgi:hypothetical protein
MYTGYKNAGRHGESMDLGEHTRKKREDERHTTDKEVVIAEHARTGRRKNLRTRI